MSYLNQYTTYKRLLDEHEAWSLLKANNAPLILVLIQELFIESNEVSFTQARIYLDAKLNQIREFLRDEAKVSAREYLYQWIKAGWIRELNNQLNKTDTCDIALRFVQSLDQRESGTTASDLQIVQDAVKKLIFDMNQNPEEKIALLKQQKVDIDEQILQLEQGIVTNLSELQQKERINKIYQLAAKLSHDFRLIEDEILGLDQQLRRNMLEHGENRGSLLRQLLEHEDLMIETNAGQAFESFFNLLSQTTHCDELHQQLQFLLQQSIAQHLDKKQTLYLSKLIHELVKESQRIFDIRKRTNESLRHYMQSSAVTDGARVTRLIQQIEQTAMQLVQQDVPIKINLDMYLNVGNISAFTPLSLKIKAPDDALIRPELEERKNHQRVSQNILKHLDNVQVKVLAQMIQQRLQQHGSMSLSKLIQLQPIEKGLEELVAYVRIAKAVKATHLNQTEQITFKDQNGALFEAKIPLYLLDSTDFPKNIDHLVI